MPTRSRPGPMPQVLDQAAPTHEEIAARAYELFLERGATDGEDLDDWLRAERELQAREADRYLTV